MDLENLSQDRTGKNSAHVTNKRLPLKMQILPRQPILYDKKMEVKVPSQEGGIILELLKEKALF